MKAILTICVVFLSHSSFSQFSFKAEERDSFNDFGRLYGDSAFNLSSNFDFRLQLVKRSSYIHRMEVYILTLKANQWEAKAFEYVWVDSNTLKWQEIVQLRNMDNSIWKKLYNNQVLTLPNDPNMVDSIPCTESRVMDAPSYRIYLMSKTAKRSYYYYIPEFYVKECPNRKEYKMMVRNIKIITGLFEKPRSLSR